MASVAHSVSLCFQIRIWNHRYEGAQILTKELVVKGKYAVAYQSAEECVKGADVIVTATFASSPILKGKWIKPGAHINGMCAKETKHLQVAIHILFSSGANSHTTAFLPDRYVCGWQY